MLAPDRLDIHIHHDAARHIAPRCAVDTVPIAVDAAPMREGLDADALVLDGFGLTRLRGAKVTTKPITGRWLARSGTRVALRDESKYQLRVLDLERLTSTTKKKLDLRFAIPHPDGTHLLVRRRQLEITDGDGAVVGVLPDDAAATLGTLALGRPLTRPLANRDPLAASDDDGTFAFYDVRAGTLLVGRMVPVADMLARPSLIARLMGRRSPPLFTASVSAPTGTPSLAAVRGRVLLGVHEPSRGLACGLLIESGRARPIEKPSLGPLVLGPSWIAWQSAPGTVQCQDDDGRLRTHTLPTGAHGEGELLASGGRLLFVTSDRESIVDVDTANVFDRKLDVRDREARAELVTFLADANARARPFDVRFELESAVRAADGTFRPRIDWTPGDLGLGAALHVGETVAAFAAKWRPPSLTGGHDLRPTNDAEVVAAVRSFDGRPEGLVSALGFCASTFGAAIGRSPKYPARPIFEGDAGRRFLSVITGAMEGVSCPSERLSVDLDVARLARAVEVLPPRPVDGYSMFEPRQGVAWLLVEVLGPEAWPLLVRWLLEVPTPYAAANLHVASAPLARLLQLHPSLRETVRAHLSATSAEPAAHRAREVQRHIDHTLE